MDVFLIHTIAFFMSVIVLIALAFIAGGMSRLKKHSAVQDEKIATIKQVHSADIKAIKDTYKADITSIKSDIKKVYDDLTEVDKDLTTISRGQERMYSDLKGLLKEVVQPLTDSQERLSNRVDRILEVIAAKK